jgi:hypothetical protein
MEIEASSTPDAILSVQGPDTPPQAWIAYCSRLRIRPLRMDIGHIQVPTQAISNGSKLF